MSEISNFQIVAFHVGSRLDVNGVVKKLKIKIIKQEESFALLAYDDDKFIYVKDFGSIVFSGFRAKEINFILNTLGYKSSEIKNFPSEKYSIETNPKSEKLKVFFDTIQIPDFNLDMIHVIMLNLSQTVALDYYQNLTSDLLEETRAISEKLMKKGEIFASRKKLRKFTGKTLVLKNRIAENLYIFETTDLAWSDEKLADIDKQLSKQLDFLNRHEGIQNNINIAKENLDLFRDILQHKHSSMLEWIIIILIVIEIVQILIEN
ncbi:MAG: RMD1 family protein [Putridiphycobacter sp.]